MSSVRLVVFGNKRDGECGLPYRFVHRLLEQGVLATSHRGGVFQRDRDIIRYF